MGNKSLFRIIAILMITLMCLCGTCTAALAEGEIQNDTVLTEEETQNGEELTGEDTASDTDPVEDEVQDGSVPAEGEKSNEDSSDKEGEQIDAALTKGTQKDAVHAEKDPAESLLPKNGIPLVIVRVDESKTSIDDMNGSPDHSVRCESATMEIVVPEGYGMDAPAGEMVLKYVRGRGHSTWQINKKPYKVELKEAKDLFGMGASTDWALLANTYDKSLMRNRITFLLGEQLGLDFTPQQIPVDLVMIGNKTGVHSYGTYCLSETIKVEENRINIGKLKKNDTANITGGYLMAIYYEQDGGEPESTRFTTKNGIEFMNDSPDYECKTDADLTAAQLAQRDYIRSYMQEVDDLIMDAEMKDGKITAEAHNRIAEKMDLTSAADYWLLQEIPYNTDGFATTSTYLYKARDGKLFWGPLWDFDYAWNNNGMWSRSNETFNNTSMLWIDHLRENDPLFVKLLRERWEVLDKKLQDLTKDSGIIDQYKQELSLSQKADCEIWKEQQGEYKGISEEEYNTDIEELRAWINERRQWVNDNLDDIGQVFYTVSYVADGKTVATEQVRHGKYAVMDPDAPVREGYVFERWKNGRKSPSQVAITEDTTFEAVYVEKDQAVEPEFLEIFLPEEMSTVELSTGFFPAVNAGVTLKEIAYVEPDDATNTRITWTSSDESVAVIDEVNHRVILKGTGDVTITGTLYNGLKGSFVLHVKDSRPQPEPEPEPEPQPAEYSVVSGEGSSWERESGTPLEFRFKRTAEDDRTFDNFTGISIDDKDIDKSQYETGKGSVIIQLKPELLDSLTTGEHRLTAVFTDGTADAHFSVIDKSDDGSDDPGSDESGDDTDSSGNGTSDAGKDSGNKSSGVKTGDETNLALWIMIAGLAAAELAVMTTARMRRRK